MLHNMCDTNDKNDLFLLSFSPLQLQNRVYRSPLAVQLHVLLEDGLSKQQPHLINFSRLAGARGVSCGTIAEKSITLYQP